MLISRCPISFRTIMNNLGIAMGTQASGEKEELPPCPCFEMREHIQTLYQQTAEELGVWESKGRHLAFRTRLYTVSWNEEGGESWCFGIGHEVGKAKLENNYNNDFLTMIHLVRDKLSNVCGLFTGRHPWQPHIRIKLFAEGDDQARHLIQAKRRSRSTPVRPTLRSMNKEVSIDRPGGRKSTGRTTQ